MSLLGLIGGGGLHRLGLSAAKVLAAGPGAHASILTAATGRPFQARQELHSLRPQQEGKYPGSSRLLALPSSSSLGRAVPATSRPMSSGDHVTLWTAERILSGALVPLLPAAIIAPCAPFDYMLAFALTLHSHWGIEAIVVDYVRPSVFGEAIPKLAVALVYGLSAMTLGGLFYFIYADVGLGQAVRLLWKL